MASSPPKVEGSVSSPGGNDEGRACGSKVEHNWGVFVREGLRTAGLPETLFDHSLEQWRAGSNSKTFATHMRVWQSWVDLARPGVFDPGALTKRSLAVGFNLAFEQGWSVGRLTVLSTVLANTCRFLLQTDEAVHGNYLVKALIKSAKAKAPSKPTAEERRTFDVAAYYEHLVLLPFPVTRPQPPSANHPRSCG